MIPFLLKFIICFLHFRSSVHPEAWRNVPMVFMVRILWNFWSKTQANVGYPSQAGSERLVTLLEASVEKVSPTLSNGSWCWAYHVDLYLSSKEDAISDKVFNPLSTEAFFPENKRCSPGCPATLAPSLGSIRIIEDPSQPHRPLGKSLKIFIKF